MTADLPRDALRRVILDLLGQRRPGATICPSEAARVAAGPEADESEWRAAMEPVRQAAQELARQGLVEITQGGEAIDPQTGRGPIRIRLTDRGAGLGD